MEDDWEAVADKEVVIRPKPKNINKWEGEDEDEDVKDSWEDEEEKKDEEKVDKKPVPAKIKPDKALKAKLAEQARIAEEEEAKRLENLTPEEKLAEKLRLQKILEKSDLNNALETFGVTSTSSGLDTFDPQSKEEFKEFGATLSWKITHYKASPHFPQFVEDLVRSICCNLTFADMKKVKISLDSLVLEKQKLERNAKKSDGKGKGKPTLRKENNDFEVYKNYDNDFVDEYDDFM